MTVPDVLAVVFFASVAGVLYAYAGFPALLHGLATRRRLAGEGASRAGGGSLPPVTVIIPAYNEEEHLAARIENVLASDYPRAQLEVIVVSDASTDRTDDIARSFEPHGVRLIVQDRRRGKTAGLNGAVDLARGDIVVFTDANTAFPASAIRRMTEYFDDSRVGLVSGFTKYTRTAGGDVADATNAYTSLERAIKRAESRWGMCVGADGAIFAMRRALYTPLRDDDINDFVLPLSVIGQGHQCVLADDVYCSEGAGTGVGSEFRRQSRITNRSLRAIWRNRYLLNPVRFPLFSFLLLSHKVARLLVPLLLVTGLVALAALAPGGGLYAWMAWAAIAVVALECVGLLLPSRSSRWGRVPRMLHLLLATNAAVLHGWWRFASGHSETTWQHDRGIDSGSSRMPRAEQGRS